MFNQEHGIDDSIMYKCVGLEKSKSATINLFKTGLHSSDLITCVSSGLRTSFYTPETSYGLLESFESKRDSTIGICNGISYENFNPFNPQVLGAKFCLPKELKAKDIISSKSFAKQALKDHGLIPSEKRPLMLYVGRFSSEKGVEYLEQISSQWIGHGGQMVIMGIYSQDKKARSHINRLIEKTKNTDNFSNYLKVYTDLKKDQLEKISNDLPVQKGKLIRFSADLLCIPSKVEACGLVAMESLSFGTPIFTSFVQGLKDMCFPYGVYHPLLKKVIDKKDFNSISFMLDSNNKKNTLFEIKKNLGRAYNIISGKVFPKEHLWNAQLRMIQRGKSFDWNSPDGSIKQYARVYKKLIDGQVSIFDFSNMNDLFPLDKNHLVRYIVNQLGGYPQKKLAFSHRDHFPFILGTLKTGKRERESEFNLFDLKERTRTIIKDGFIYQNNDDTIFDTGQMKKNPSFYVTWVLNKKGELFCGAQCHAFFLKSKRGNPHYGFSKPVACAGDIIIRNGKIIYIDNRSGHYMPSLDQMLIATHYLHTLGILDKNCEIRNESTGTNISYADIINIAPEKIVSQYPSLENLRY
ncbi:MAG: glycogen synthase [bacterium]|nr:glycogen synthase [bacterium]